MASSSVSVFVIGRLLSRLVRETAQLRCGFGVGMPRRSARGEEHCSWVPMLALFLMASLLKLLVLAPGMYHSTDFEVRRERVCRQQLSSTIIYQRELEQI